MRSIISTGLASKLGSTMGSQPFLGQYSDLESAFASVGTDVSESALDSIGASLATPMASSTSSSFASNLAAGTNVLANLGKTFASVYGAIAKSPTEASVATGLTEQLEALKQQQAQLAQSQTYQAQQAALMQQAQKVAAQQAANVSQQGKLPTWILPVAIVGIGVVGIVYMSKGK